MSESSKDRDLRAGLVVTGVGMGVNILLAVLKLVVGYAGRSQALIADGVHSFSDLASDIVVWLGLKWGRKEEDESHHYGHGRIETLSSMFTGFILLLIAGGIAYDSIDSIYNQEQSNPGPLTIAVAAFSILAKEALYWYTRAVGKRIRSMALIGNAWHHRTDALSSVAVLIGVTGAYIDPDWVLADSLAAIIVTYFVARVGAKLVWGAVKEFVDTAPDQKIQNQLLEVAAQVPDVHEVHDLRARYSGPRIQVELHVVVDPDISVREGHAIAKAVEARILDEVSDVERVITHVDPEPKPKD